MASKVAESPPYNCCFMLSSHRLNFLFFSHVISVHQFDYSLTSQRCPLGVKNVQRELRKSWTFAGTAAALENLPAHVQSIATLYASIPRLTRKNAVELNVDVKLMQHCTELRDESLKKIEKDCKKKKLLAAEREQSIKTATLPENFQAGDNIMDLAIRHGVVHHDMTPTERATAYRSLSR